MRTPACPDPWGLLSTFEAAVHARRHEDAFAAAVTLLDELGGDSLFANLTAADYRGQPWLQHTAFCERFAAAWATLLLDDAVDMTRMPLGALLCNLLPVHLMVQGTADGTCDVAIRVLTERTGGRHSASSAACLALLWVPGSRLGIDLFALHAGMPQLVTAQAVATVAALVACTPEQHAAREAAIAFLASGRARVEDYAPFGISNDLGGAWMRCSYAPARAGHDVKEFLNRVIARHEEATSTLPVPSPVPAADGKPVMLVILDLFHSLHAMYRCYAPLMEACRAHFHLVALACAGTLDDISAKLFDRVIDADRIVPAPGESRYAAVARAALECRPALAFYPSVGMRQLTYVLSQYRLAPVQAMTLGHPATSRSPQMDVLVMEEQWMVDRARYGERVVTVPRGTLRFVLPAGTLARRHDRHDGIVRIAVPSFCQKWTLPFMQALQRVEERVGSRVEFNFFAGIRGIGFPSAMQAVQRAFPRATVHSLLPLAEYYARLARCDVHAGTFPFGGTNSIIDSLVLGLPVLCMAPEDARGAQDADFIARVGLPDWLVARDVDDYAAKLIRLVEEPGTLGGLHALLADQERVKAVFLEEGHPEVFAAALRALVGP